MEPVGTPGGSSGRVVRTEVEDFHSIPGPSRGRLSRENTGFNSITGGVRTEERRGGSLGHVEHIPGEEGVGAIFRLSTRAHLVARTPCWCTPSIQGILLPKSGHAGPRHISLLGSVDIQDRSAGALLSPEIDPLRQNRSDFANPQLCPSVGERIDPHFPCSCPPWLSIRGDVEAFGASSLGFEWCSGQKGSLPSRAGRDR